MVNNLDYHWPHAWVGDVLGKFGILQADVINTVPNENTRGSLEEFEGFVKL